MLGVGGSRSVFSQKRKDEIERRKQAERSSAISTAGMLLGDLEPIDWIDTVSMSAVARVSDLPTQQLRKLASFLDQLADEKEREANDLR
jgi:hypothetical protein